MSPTSVSSSFSAPPAPPAPQDASDAASADPANQPARSFRQVLDDQSSSAAPQQKPATPKGDASQESGDTGSQSDPPTDADATSASQGATDGKNAKGTQTAGKAGGTAKVTAAKKGSNGKLSPDEAAGHKTDPNNAQGLVADEQTPTPEEEKQGADEKPKNAKAAATTIVTDGSTATALAAAAAACASTAASSTSTDTEIKTNSTEVSKVADQPHATTRTNEKTAAKSTLHAEEAVRPAKKDGSTTGKNTAVASGDSEPADPATSAQAVTSVTAAAADVVAKTPDHPAVKGDFAAVSQQLADAGGSQKTIEAAKTAPAQPAVAPAPTAADFAAANHAQIVNSVHTQLLPNGGSMRLRLDPPDLGAMQVTVRMRDGVMSAEFQTSNDQAAKLLSHSLGDLKTQLESQGMSVDKLHVTSSPQESHGKAGDSESRQQRDQSPTDEQRREQQRKEMLRRMWSKLAKGEEPLNMVA
jgi:flagellar hook-length control protein FliK